MAEPFAAGMLSTFIPGRAYLKPTSASVVRTIGASSNKPSSSTNFLTPVRGAKGNTNEVNNCQIWESREWACSVSRPSICCSISMPPLMLEEQSQNFRPSSVHRTSQSSRQRLHSLRRLTSEFRANQRRHISQSSFPTGGESKTLTADSPLNSSESLDLFPSSPTGGEPKTSTADSPLDSSESFDLFPSSPTGGEPKTLTRYPPLTEFLPFYRLKSIDLFPSSPTGGEPKTVTADSPLDSSKSLDRFRKGLELSSLPMGPNFDGILEKSLGEVEELLPSLPETELIELLHALADRLDEILYPPYRDIRHIHIRIRIWGKRLEDLCRLLPSSPSVHSPQQALITRAQAMMGMLSPSIAYVNSIEKWDDHSFHAGGTVILAVAFHRRLFRSLSLILRESSFLSIRPPHSYIDNVICVLLSRTPNVLTVIPMAVQANWTVAQKENLRSFLFSSNSDDPKRLMHIITELLANNIAVSRDIILKTSIFLLLAKDITNARKARKLYDSIPSSIDNIFFSGINLGAMADNSKQVQTLLDILKARGDVDKREIADLLLSYAEGGHVQGVLRVFDEYFPKNDEGKRLNQPNVHHYAIAMLAHVRNGDYGAVATWLEDMQRSGLQPDSYIFTTLIQAYSNTKGLQGILDVISMMQKLGTKPDVATYTTLLRVFAYRMDPDGAESLYKLACEEGIIPDQRMTRSLMITFANSGSLGRATRVFDYLNSHFRNRRYLSSMVYQIIIRTHVAMRAPFPVVSRLFFGLEKIHPFTSTYSYALLILSACDAGQLNKATDIYYEMIRAVKFVSPLSAYVPTVIMSAFLLQGNRVKAKEIYDEMIERGIRPTIYTYREIIRSYRNEGTPESLRIADKLINRLPDWILLEDKPRWKFRVYGPFPSPSAFLSAKKWM